MALDINGYNATFKAFTDFATQSVEAGKSKAVARAGGEGPLAGRVITAAKHDWVGIGAGRLGSLKDANNAARDLFRNAIADMFGGPDKIPQGVKDAMKLADFGKGKPLTARRIIAVKNAIDASGVMKQKALDDGIAGAKFSDPATQKAALAKGYSKGELPKIAAATSLYAQTAGCTEAEALEQVTTSGTPANRLMNYGGRFLQSAGNFKNGLRLIDSFAKWISDTNATLKATGDDFKEGMSLTLLNASSSYISPKFLRGMEKFVFEELASNPAHDLAEQDADKLFGLENNAATRFFGRGYGGSYTQTVANIPPVKRAAFYAAFDAAFPLVSDPAIAKLPQSERPPEFIKKVDRSLVFGRIMKNLDKLAVLHAAGTLTSATFVKTCFPEARRNTLGAVNDLFKQWDIEINGDEDRGIPSKYPGLGGPIIPLMEETGCTVKEAAAALQPGGARPATPQYVAAGSLPLEAFDGTTHAAREQLVGDLKRPTDYNYIGDKKTLLPKGYGFRFNFPDGTTYKTNATEEGLAQIETVADKAEALCGPAHREQASSVVMMLSQSGLCVLRGGLKGYGIESSEHAAVDFTLSRNAETGDISIRYSSPKELPFSFEWSATIKPDGFVSTTPLRFLDERQTPNCRAGVEEAVKNMQNPRGTHNQFFKADKARAVPLIETMMHATGGDKDVINLLKDTYVCTSLLYNFANNLRPADVILSRVARLKENVAELREATKGNPAMFKMGLSRLAGLGGKPVPKGMLASLVKAVNAADIGKLRKLSAASTTPVKMNAAIVQYHAAVGQAIKKSGILAMFDGDVGGEEMLGMSMLAGGLVAARLGQDALRSIKGALESPVAGQLQAIYTDLNNEDLVEAGVPKHEATIMKRTVSELSSDILSLLDNVNATLGVEGGNVPAFTGSLDDLDGFDDIAIEIRDMTNKVHADLIQMEREENEAREAQRKAGANGMQGGNLVIEP